MGKMKIKMAYDGEKYELKGYNTPLAPCPFCGSAENLYFTKKKNFEKLYKENGGACIEVECRTCNVEMFEHDYPGRGYATKVKCLIKKWKTRGGDADEK